MNIIREDLKTHREGLLALGFWALLVYRFGHARFAINNKWLRLPWTCLYIFLNKFTEIITGIIIGSTAQIGRRFQIEHHGCIVIHGATVIGDDCLIRHGVTLGNTGRADPLGAPILGDNVELGAGAKLLGRIVIGKNVVVAANAVVIRDVPENTVVGGVPAKPLSSTLANKLG